MASERSRTPLISLSDTDLFSFVGHVVLMIVGFTIMLGCAVMLNMFGAYVEAPGRVAHAIAWILRAVSYLLLAADLIWFSVLLLVEGWHFFWRRQNY